MAEWHQWIKALDDINFEINTAEALRSKISPFTLSWLDERTSMTKRLKKHCNEIGVYPMAEYSVGPNSLSELSYLPHDKSFWVRDVIMPGDGIPFLSARTVLPKSTVDAIDIPVEKLGTTPIGKYLFADPGKLSREAIHIGSVVVGGILLFGRRSLFKYSGHPFCLTELFLPEGPAYSCNISKLPKL